ncbi:MmyB family transcriptional regulator [Streptomyces sp. NPDC003299]
MNAGDLRLRPRCGPGPLDHAGPRLPAPARGQAARRRSHLGVTQPAHSGAGHWEQEARALLGQFRSRAARRPTGPLFAELVGELLSDSDAARWYERRETAGFEPSVRRFRHPTVGELRLRYVELAAVDEPGHHLLAYLPDDQDSEGALRRLQAGE